MPHPPHACLASLACFDKRSVLLFAALSLGSIAALHAQPQPNPAGTAPGTGQSAPGAVISPGPTSPAADQSGSAGLLAAGTASQAAFERADSNSDGQLSATEAAALPAIGNRFEELDTDRSGMLSSAEFEEGAKP